MRIAHRTNILVKTERKFIVRGSSSDETIVCEQCAERMVSAQASADFFGFSSRIVYRLIESGKIHFAETETNEVYVCPISLKKILRSIL